MEISPLDPQLPTSLPQGPRTWDEDLLAWFGPRLADLQEADPERIQRIDRELVIGFDTLEVITKGVSVFGSARSTEDSPGYAKAREVGRLLGALGFAVITGGGPGMMEAANRGAREVGALSVGLNIELPHEQHSNPYLDISLPFHYFFVRKLMFVRYACAFVVLPGGFGTLDEMFEALTLIQTGKIQNFPVVLVGTEYWSPLVDWIRGTLLEHDAIDARDLELLHVTDDLDEVCRLVTDFRAMQVAQPFGSDPAP